MEQNIKLKLQDTLIMEYNFHEGIYEIHRPELLPFRLRDNLVDSREKDLTFKDYQHNMLEIMNFYAKRVINLRRQNAKYILNALYLSQSDGFEEKAKIMEACKGLSVTDDYWITESDTDQWAEVNLRDNPLDIDMAEWALTGASRPIRGEIRTAELTTLGTYAKAWFREEDGLYLYKASSVGGNESLREVCTSKILDYTNARHLHYETAEKDGVLYAKCKNMCDEKHSIVTAEDVRYWCKRKSIDFIEFVEKLDKEEFYKMIIIDYLIANKDRHGANWGFYMDNTTGEILGLHPLFDHNNAFDEGDMLDTEGGMSLIFENLTKKEAAMGACKKCHLEIAKDIPKNIFVNREHYKMFSKRAKELEIY